MKSVTIFLMLVFSVGLVWGQTTAQIHGTILDASGAAVSGAAIKVTQTDTGVTRTATSEADGGYLLTSLPLGPYRVEVSKEGFSTAVQTGIVLEVGSDLAISLSLKVGAVAETVSVEATANQVETRNVGVGTLVENTQRILDLPLNGRQPTDLISLGGAAVVQSVAPTYTINGGVQISVAGATAFSVQYYLDGASHLDTWYGQNLPLPFPDALQEFRLSTSTQNASEGGGRSGAAVNAVTRSGTNSFHGDAFEFFRNGDLNGRDFFAASNDHLKRNQFGGVLGGPIKKDKLFFFAGYQGTIIRQTPSNTVSYVPTAAMINGDFSAYIANKCPEASRISPTVLSPTNQLTKPINPSAATLAKLLPTPLNACGQVLTGNPLATNQLQAPARIDYQLTDKQSLFGRYLISRNETTPPYVLQPQNLIASNGTGDDDTAQSVTLGHTYVISPTLVNSVRLFVNRMGVVNQYKPFLNPGPESAQVSGLPSLGIRNFTNCPGPQYCLPGMVSLNVSGDFLVGNPASINMVFLHFTNFGLNEDLNIIRGSHQISLGAMAMHLVEVEEGDAWIPGVFTFSGLSPAAGGTGSPMADFLTGTVGNLHQYSLNPNNNTQTFLNLYASDVWKVNSRLTLSYGLRWNPYFPLQWMGGTAENFSLQKFYANERSKTVPTAPPGFTFPGDPGFEGRSGISPIWNQFEPRIGFAYDPFGDGKTAIRGNVGIAHDFLQAFPFQNSPGVAPFVSGLSLNGPLNFSDPYANVPGGNPFPYTYSSGTPFPTYPPYQGFYPYQSHLPNTEQQSWALAVQRQMTSGLFVSATYLGTHLIHLWDALELNPAIFIPGNCAAGQYGLTAPGLCSQATNVNQRRLLELTNPAGAGTILGSMDSFDTSGTQSYNGLLLSATYRKGNTSLSGNYTWSHCKGMPIIGTTNIGSTYEHAPYQNNGPQNRYLDYGDCYTSAVDVRHVANITMVTATPKFSNAWANRLAGGWHFGTIYSIRTGIPLTPSAGADIALNGMFASSGSYNYVQRPNQVLSDVYAPNKGQSCPTAPCVNWINKAAFANPAPGTYGNMAFGTLRGPKLWEWDQSVYRDFKVTEAHTLQVRAEAFNVTNSVRFYVPNVLLTNGLFGQITSDYSTTGSSIINGSGGRIIQFAMKYVF